MEAHSFVLELDGARDHAARGLFLLALVDYVELEAELDEAELVGRRRLVLVLGRCRRVVLHRVTQRQYLKEAHHLRVLY